AWPMYHVDSQTWVVENRTMGMVEVMAERCFYLLNPAHREPEVLLAWNAAQSLWVAMFWYLFALVMIYVGWMFSPQADTSNEIPVAHFLEPETLADDRVALTGAPSRGAPRVHFYSDVP